MTFLLTGFDPFGGDTINPAYEAIKYLPEEINGHNIIKKEIPTIFYQSIQVLRDIISEMDPDWVIAVGQAEGRIGFTPEKVAINYSHARIPDNAGCRPQNQMIRKEGPVGYFTRLPIHQIVKNCLEASIPASVSYSAGTFVCNHLFYGLMDIIHEEYPHIRGGFIHVPALPEQALKNEKTPFMSLEMITKALEQTIIACLDNPDDQQDEFFGGDLH